MARISFTLNDEPHSLEVDPDMKLLWAIRDVAGLTGTKYSCGQSLCGTCTVHLDGKAVRSCGIPVSRVAGKRITTIEGLNTGLGQSLQRAWVAEDVPQCGYCQPGQIMAAAALLSENGRPSDKDIDQVMSTTLCRCGTYQRIRRAIHRAAGEV